MGEGVACPPHPQRFLSRVCFARVTCLIISFSGGRLFLVSTVTAPLRGEAIRQRVKQVIKTLKPMCTERGRDGGRGLSEVRRPGSSQGRGGLAWLCPPGAAGRLPLRTQDPGAAGRLSLRAQYRAQSSVLSALATGCTLEVKPEGAKPERK